MPGFTNDYVAHSLLYVAWYACFAFEWLMVGLLSTKDAALGFKYTHLNTRLKLLTLIILGESVIAVTKSVNQIVGWGGAIWTWDTIMLVAASTVTVVSWCPPQNRICAKME